MPQDNDFVSKALASAKKTMEAGNKFSASAGDAAGKFAPKPAPASPPKAAAPASGSSGFKREVEDVGAGIKARGEQVKAIGSMKKGGEIKKTGLYKMHKGEEVVKTDKSNLNEVVDRATKGLAGKKSKLHMSIEPTDDDRFIVNHEHRGGSEPVMPSSERHAPANLEELISHIKKHYGSPAAQVQSEAGGGSEE